MRRKALDDLIGAALIDSLDGLKASADNPAKMDWVPVSEAQLQADAAKWGDAAFRAQKVSEWGQAARAHWGG